MPTCVSNYRLSTTYMYYWDYDTLISPTEKGPHLLCAYSQALEYYQLETDYWADIPPTRYTWSSDLAPYHWDTSARHRLQWWQSLPRRCWTLHIWRCETSAPREIGPCPGSMPRDSRRTGRGSEGAVSTWTPSAQHPLGSGWSSWKFLLPIIYACMYVWI